MPVPKSERPDPEAPPAPSERARDGADICVILNTGARSGADRADALGAALDRHPGRFELRRVEAGSRIAETADAAVSAGFPVIVAAGGDGTIGAVAERLLDTGRTLGVIPLGTFNYLARTLDLPEDDIDGALAVILDGTPRPLAVGEVNGRIFLNNASLGAYAAILQRREGVYRRWGRSRLGAYWSVLATLARFRRPLTLKVTVDGEVRRVSTPLAFVANNPSQLERFDLDGADCIRSGRFALFIAPDCGRIELIRYALRLALRAMKPERDFELLCGRDIVVESPHRARRLVARDGERDRMTAPLHFRLRPDALTVLAPRTEP
jgi:diacylglycerol kinase family enzyme